MKRYIRLMPVGGLLIATLAALPLHAQEKRANKVVEQNTPAALERMKMENFWFRHTENAAGSMLDNTIRYSCVNLGYGIENGSFRRPQAGKRKNGLDFHTEGGGIYEKMRGIYAWGSFSYSRHKVHDAEYNASIIDPFRGMPYIIADTNRSNWINQSYLLDMKLSTPLLWKKVIFGLSGSYENATGAKQLDPRPLVRLARFSITPSVILKIDGTNAIGAHFNFATHKEDGSANNSNYRRDQYVWELRGLGFHSEGIIGGIGGIETLRNFKASALGGGIQYSYNKEDFRMLMSGKCDYRVEDVTNNYSRPKMVGTVKELDIEGKIAIGYRTGRGNSLIGDLSYSDRDIDGIEYVQVYDNEYDKQEWVTKVKNIRSNFSNDTWNMNLDYLVNKANGYRWNFGFSAKYSRQADTYYIPRSWQDIDNLYFQLRSKRNFEMGGYSHLLVGMEIGLNTNSKADLFYAGPDASSRIIKDFTQRDFDCRSAEYWEGGLSLVYSYGNIMQQKSNLYVSARMNYKDLTSDHPLLGQRFVCSFAVGLNF